MTYIDGNGHTEQPIPLILFSKKFLKYLFTYLATLGLSWGMQDL